MPKLANSFFLRLSESGLTSRIFLVQIHLKDKSRSSIIPRLALLTIFLADIPS